MPVRDRSEGRFEEPANRDAPEGWRPRSDNHPPFCCLGLRTLLCSVIPYNCRDLSAFGAGPKRANRQLLGWRFLHLLLQTPTNFRSSRRRGCYIHAVSFESMRLTLEISFYTYRRREISRNMPMASTRRFPVARGTAVRGRASNQVQRLVPRGRTF